MEAGALGSVHLDAVGGVAFKAAIPETRYREVFHQEEVRRDLRHLARGEADRQQAAFGLTGAKGLIEGRPADGIIDHVDAAFGAVMTTCEKLW